MDTHTLGLVAVGRFDYDLPKPEERPVIAHKVTGLPSSHACQIVFAGTGASGQRTWAIQWSRHGTKVTVPKVFYDSPEEALAVVERMLPEMG